MACEYSKRVPCACFDAHDHEMWCKPCLTEKVETLYREADACDEAGRITVGDSLRYDARKIEALLADDGMRGLLIALSKVAARKAHSDYCDEMHRVEGPLTPAQVRRGQALWLAVEALAEERIEDARLCLDAAAAAV